MTFSSGHLDGRSYFMVALRSSMMRMRMWPTLALPVPYLFIKTWASHWSLILKVEVEGHYPHCHYVGQIALHQRQSIPFAATDIVSHGPHDLGYVHDTPLLSPTMPSVYPVMSVLDDHDPLVGERVFFSPRLPTVMTIASTTWMRRVGITPLLVIAVRTPRLMTALLLQVIFQLVPIVVHQLILAIPWSLMVIPIMTITTTSSRPTPSYPLGNPLVNDDSMEITDHHAPDDCTYGHHPRCVMASDDALDDRPPPAPPPTILCLSANDASQLVAPIASGAFSLPVIVVLPHLQTSLYFILYSLL